MPKPILRMPCSGDFPSAFNGLNRKLHCECGGVFLLSLCGGSVSLVEQGTENPRVGGSNPPRRTKYIYIMEVYELL